MKDPHTYDIDNAMVESYAMLDFFGECDIQDKPGWVLQLELSRDKMLEYDVRMLDAYMALVDHFSDNLAIKISDDRHWRCSIADHQDAA